MALSNQERVGKAMELLRKGLAPFVEREFKNLHGDRALEVARRYFPDDRIANAKLLADWDVAALLKVLWDSWNEVFGRTLGRAERSLVTELRDARNKWAHQEPFSSDDADRALDSMARLLTAVSAPEADEVNRMKLELRRLTFDEQVRGEKRKAGGSLIEAAATGTLKPWREVATPGTNRYDPLQNKPGGWFTSRKVLARRKRQCPGSRPTRWINGSNLSATG